MNTTKEATLEVSFPRALSLSAIYMALFVVALLMLGLPLHDPLLVGFLILMVTGMTFVFAGCFCFMFRCKIGDDGLRSAVPTLYQQVLRWEEVAVVRGIGTPFYVVRGRFFGGFCLLPRRFLLKRPDSLRELIERYAPADNIVRKKVAA